MESVRYILEAPSDSVETYVLDVTGTSAVFTNTTVGCQELFSLINRSGADGVAPQFVVMAGNNPVVWRTTNQGTGIVDSNATVTTASGARMGAFLPANTYPPFATHFAPDTNAIIAQAATGSAHLIFQRVG